MRVGSAPPEPPRPPEPHSIALPRPGRAGPMGSGTPSGAGTARTPRPHHTDS